MGERGHMIKKSGKIWTVYYNYEEEAVLPFKKFILYIKKILNILKYRRVYYIQIHIVS